MESNFDSIISQYTIPFNKPYVTGSELKYISEALASGHISGNGHFTKLCQHFIEKLYGINKVLLTTSCTDALEMCAILLGIKPGDEIIVPSYTFVSTALAFVRQGAKIIFADSREDHPGIEEDHIEKLITKKTKAVIVVHYAGVACDMDKIMNIAEKHNIFVVEDAAQAIHSQYIYKTGIKKYLGSIAHLGVFSFHETKNVQCGEGGILAINDKRFINRSEIIWEKGTNRTEFFRGSVNKYGWVDIGSSFLPSEICAAFLWAQFEKIDDIQKRRIQLWDLYYSLLKRMSLNSSYSLPVLPDYATQNGHMFYLVCRSLEERSGLIDYLRRNGIYAAFHYQSLHKSEYYKKKYHGGPLINADHYTDCLVRLPIYFDLKEQEIETTCSYIKQFFS